MRPRLRHRVQPPRHLLWILAIAAAISTTSLGWVAWQLLEQDTAAQAQRAQEYVEYQADRAVQGLERLVADTERQLADWAARPQDAPPVPSHGGLVVVASGDAIRTTGSPALLFRPGSPSEIAPADPRFADADAAEFGQRDYARARALLLPLTRDANAAVRASALLRLGRVQRAGGDVRAARRSFQSLAALEDTRVAGLPAGLAGRVAEMQWLADGGDATEAATVARSLAQALTDGRWAVSEAQFEHYLDLADSIAHTSVTVDPHQLAVTRAVAALADEARTGLLPSGRRTVATDAGALLALWRTTPDVLVVWVASATPLLARLEIPGGVVVTEGSQRMPPDRHSPPQAVAVRHASDTGLPWTIRTALTDAGLPASGGTRRALVVLGVGLLVVSLITGFWFAGRAAQRELELARAQADFVSTVSHEFRTPLAAMRQLSELLASGRVATDARRHQYYESLAAESRRLQRLVENLLDFGRLQAGARVFTLQPLATADLVQRVVEEFRAQPLSRSCAIEVDASSPPITMQADADAMALALHNLLDNAVKYSGDDAHVAVSWRQDGSRVALSVRDSGIGIEPGERERIFERFVRGSGAAAQKARGTGIGLAVVKQVVTGQGGEVAVDSAPGQGSTFTIWLPLAPARNGEAA